MSKNSFQIVVIRHGFSLGNALQTLSGQSDVPLIEKGRKELVKFRETYKFIDTDLYYSSDLSRCISTFEALFGPEKKLDKTFKELREIDFRERENERFLSRDRLIALFEKWIVDDPEAQGVESFDEIKNRMLKVFYQTLDDLKNNNLHSATLFTHSCAMRCLLIGLGLFTRDQYHQISVKNGQGYVINVEYDDKLVIKECVALFDYLEKKNK
jgi:broad specificity phosphatase PhoE